MRCFIPLMALLLLPAAAFSELKDLPGFDECVKAGIESDSSNLSFEPESKRGDQALPPDSFAAAYPDPGKRIRWTPLREPGSFTATRLRGTAQSADLTALIFMERTGKTDGPYGTRFLVTDALNLRILAVFEVPFDVSSFVPGNNGEIWCIREPQKYFDETSGVYILGPDGKIKDEIPVSLKSLVPDITGRKMFGVTPEGTVLKVSRDGSSEPWGNFEDAETITAAPNRMLFALQGRNRTRILRPNTNMPFDLPGKIEKVLFYDSEQIICAAGTGTGATNYPWKIEFFNADGSREISNDCSGHMVLDSSGKYLYISRMRGDLAKINIETGEIIRTMNPRSLKPATRGGIQAFFTGKTPETFLILEPSGTLYRVSTEKKLWKKDLIMQAAK